MSSGDLFRICLSDLGGVLWPIAWLLVTFAPLPLGASNRETAVQPLPPTTQQAADSSVGESQLASTAVKTPSPLPPEVLGLRPRSAQLELMAQQADTLTRKGFDLAGRGAYLAARAQFRAALVVLAQGLDAEEGTPRHGAALSRAWTALREAEDFLPLRGEVPAGETLRQIIARHETPILKEETFTQITALDAFRHYLGYAQDLLAQAAGHEVAGSMALRGLGKLYGALAESADGVVPEPLAQAVVFFQAALMVCPENYMAANDLGVLFARAGRWREAAQVLEYAARIHPDETVTRNLAKAREMLKVIADAPTQAAGHQVGFMSGTGGGESQVAQAVVWVPPEVLVRPDSGLSVTPTVGQAEPRSRFFAGVPAVSELLSARGGARLAKRWQPGSARSREEAALSPQADAVTASLDATVEDRRDESTPGGNPGDGSATGVGQGGPWTPSPASPCPRCAVDGSVCDPRRWGGWERARMIGWERFAQGEYVGLARTAHVPEYRLRVDDELEIVYRLTRDETSKPYRLNVGDQIRIESASDPTLNRDVLIQPDGTITVLLLGQVKATGFTVEQLRQRLEEMYRRYYRVPAITVTPLLVNSKLEDLRATVDRRAGEGGQSQRVRVTPEGTISLPGVGSVRAQGLTLRELQLELNELYRREVEGLETIPILIQRAPRFVYVLGEVNSPGRFELTGPTTVIQAISMAGGWKPGANLRQVVVFRRGEDWRLLATMLNLEAALHGNKATPCDEIWLADSDVVLVPKSFIQRADDFIELVFTRGIYGVFPLSATINFSKLSTI